MAVRKLDFLYCGSANDGFFAQIAFARLCLDALGGDFRDARVVAALAEYETPEVPARWQPYFERIEVIWANPEGLPNDGWLLQHYARYPAIRDDADIAVISDADVCVFRPFDGLVDELIAAPAIAGVIAHYHFPLDGQRGDPGADWSRIARHALGRDVARPHRYLYGRDPYEPRIHDAAARPPAPFYLNYGVVMGTPRLLKMLGAGEMALKPVVEEITGPYWAPQVALALTCDDLSLPVRALPPRYNWANRPETIELYPGEAAQISLFHNMDKKDINGSRIFTTEDHFRAFIEAEYQGSNEIFRRHVLKVTGGRYPFPARS